MSVFALAPCEGGSEIDLEDGKVTVGRGPFLRILDKRVSRHHAIIEVSGSTVTVQPIHTNPTFYKACGGTKFEPLDKDQLKQLHNGDIIAFLPNDVIFKVVKKLDENESAEMEIKDGNESVGMKTKEQNESVEKETKEEIKIEKKGEKNEIDLPIIECEEKQEIVEPLKKTRNLPSWMTNSKDKTSSNKSKKSTTSAPKSTTSAPKSTTSAPKSKKSKKIQECTETVTNHEEIRKKSQESTETVTNDEKIKKKSQESAETVTKSKKSKNRQESTETVRKEEAEMKAQCTKQDSDGDVIETKDATESDDSFSLENLIGTKNKIKSDDYVENEDETERKSPVSEEEPKKRKRKKSGISDDDESPDESPDVSSRKPQKTLPSCSYGKSCYRKNPAHFEEYTHDQSSDKSDKSDTDENSEEELPECPFGLECYRRNRQHQKEYKHTATPKTRPRRAKKPKTKDAEEDDDLPNDYDYNDSFLNDSESSCEPSEVEEESDWQPDNEESGDEDVGQLLSEAKEFKKNKKMYKT